MIEAFESDSSKIVTRLCEPLVASFLLERLSKFSSIQPSLPVGREGRGRFTEGEFANEVMLERIKLKLGEKVLFSKDSDLTKGR